MQRFLISGDYLVYRRLVSAGFRCTRLHTADLPALWCTTSPIPLSVFAITERGWFCWLPRTASPERDLVKHAELQSVQNVAAQLTQKQIWDQITARPTGIHLNCKAPIISTHVYPYLNGDISTGAMFTVKPTAGLAFLRAYAARCHTAVKDVALQKQQVPGSCLQTQTLHLLRPSAADGFNLAVCSAALICVLTNEAGWRLLCLHLAVGKRSYAASETSGWTTTGSPRSSWPVTRWL